MGFLKLIGILCIAAGAVLGIAGVAGAIPSMGTTILAILPIWIVVTGIGVFLVVLEYIGILLSTGIALILIGIGTSWAGGLGIPLILLGVVLVYFGYRRRYRI